MSKASHFASLLVVASILFVSATNASAQQIDSRYTCQNRAVILTSSGRAVNAPRLIKATNARIAAITRQIAALQGNTPAIRRKRQRLIRTRTTLRTLVNNIRSCLRGTFVPTPTPTPPGPTPTPTLTPTPGVPRPFLALGGDHQCSTSASGIVRCLGDNSFGQLGIGPTPSTVSTPVIPVGLSATPFVAVESGERHTCAAPQGGGMLCWGFNQNSQLGDNSILAKSTPVPVLLSGGTPLQGQFVQVVAGSGHTCGVQPSGSVVCWGLNNSGESGNGSTSTTAQPSNVVGLATTVTRVSSHFRHTCAVLGNGRLQCWGLNAQGQLGMGGVDFNIRTQATTPNNLRQGVDIIDVATGSDHTCALYRDGIVQCVGQNDVGQIGNGTTANQVMSWTNANVSGVSAVAAGDDFTCAVVNNRSGVSCWGRGLSGQLGNGSSNNSSSPVGVQGLTGTITGIAAGDDFACALIDDTSVRCWGSNVSSQLGSTGGGASNVAIAVPNLTLNG